MSLTKIIGAGIYYLETGELHTDIPSPVRGDLAVYTYAPAGGFKGQEYSFNGITWFVRGQITSDSADVAANKTVIGYGASEAQSYNRERATVDTNRESVFFTPAQNVKSLVFTILDTDSVVTDPNAALAVCFDALDDATADQWLTASDLEAFDVERRLIPAKGESSRVFTFAEPLERVDFKAVGAETLLVSIGGA